ncbi:L-rhamnose mutarotase [Marinicrinis lubricantis]|uniref:L-rhamnose mutarotase n=1 Tax=Marinicrinis lubricantis TaxID=2086470 RepID=A0ABW1IRZ9_9BACL
MEHVAFVLSIDPAQKEEYWRRHQQVDPELEQLFAEVGIHRYHIFFHEGTLFAYMEVDNFEEAMSRIASHPADQRWQEYMADMLKLWENGSTSKVIPEMYRFVAGQK